MTKEKLTPLFCLLINWACFFLRAIASARGTLDLGTLEVRDFATEEGQGDEQRPAPQPCSNAHMRTGLGRRVHGSIGSADSTVSFRPKFRIAASPRRDGRPFLLDRPLARVDVVDVGKKSVELERPSPP